MNIVKMLITGVSPVLMNNPISMRGGGEELQRGGKKIPLPLDEARGKLYALPWPDMVRRGSVGLGAAR